MVCVLACGTSLGLFMWLAQSVAAAAARREAIVARIADLAGQWATVRSTSFLSQERAADLERIKKFYLNPREPVAFVETLETVAKSTGNRITLTADEGTNSGGGIIFRATLDGTQGSVVRFVRALERAPYLIHVQEISFQNVAAEKSGGSGVSLRAGARMIVIIRVRTL